MNAEPSSREGAWPLPAGKRRVGTVLDPETIGEDAPAYIRSLRDEGALSMLHLELYSRRPEPSERYSDGNWFGPGRPRGLLDPTGLLLAISEG